jgi:hypothetical protein
MPRLAALLVGATALLCALPAHAVGESQNGFPNWAERVMVEWMNRARADPQAELAGCGAACGEAACYAPIAPLAYDSRLNRAARFHSDEMRLQGYFAHDSQCTLVQDIGTQYPGTCDGAVGCACEGGASGCLGTCSDFAARVSRFGGSPGGEVIAGDTDPDRAFHAWLYESYPGAQCQYDGGNPTNGHRWNILMSTAGVGAGASGPAVADFSLGAGAAPAQIPSGAHYPRQAASVDVWASWYDTGAPRSARVVVDGVCTPLMRARGSDANGAYTATLGGVASGCHRYYFAFTDAGGKPVTYPTTGSLGIGPERSCDDWNATRTAAGCDGAPDGSSDGGPDGSSDGGPSTPGSAGCGCAVAGRGPVANPGGLVVWTLLFGGGLFAVRRACRRRASSVSSSP